MSVQTLIIILRKNLEQLAYECRKFPVILDAIRNSRIALKKISNMFGMKENETTLLKPYILTLEHCGGSEKALSACFNCIQELIKRESIKIVGVNTLLDMILRLPSHGTVIHVKILQILLTVLTTRFYESQLNQMILGKILTICTYYFITSDLNSVLNGTSIVVMKQSINIIFPPKNTKSELDIPQNANVMKKLRISLLQDLCSFVERSNGKWIKVKMTKITPVDFFLDVLEEIIVSHSSILQSDDDYMLILKGNIFSTLLNGFNDDKDSHFPEIFRIYRLCIVILKMVLFSKKMRSQCVEILKHLTSQVLNQKTKMWKRVLALEVYRQFAEDHTMFIQSILQERNYYESKEVIIQILDAVTAYILKTKERGVRFGKFQYSPNKGKRLESVTKLTVPFSTDEFECMTLVMDTLIGSISSLNILVNSSYDTSILLSKENRIKDEDEEESGEDDEEEEEEEEVDIKEIKITGGREGVLCVKKIVEIEWTNILKSCNHLLENCKEPDTLQRILQVYFLFTNTCGAIAGLSSSIRDSFLSSLLKYVTRIQTAEQLEKSKKSQMIVQILFDISNSLGSKFLGSSWFILLKNFHEIYGIVLSSYSSSTSSSKSPSNDQPSSPKRKQQTHSLPKIFRLILHRLDSLFKNNVSSKYPLESFIHLLKAVIGLSKESLIKKKKKKWDLGQDYYLFFAKKLFVLLEYNSLRIGEILKQCPDVMEHIRYLSTHSLRKVKIFVVSEIFKLLITVFSKKKEITKIQEEKESDNKISKATSIEEIEKLFFGVLTEANDYSNELEESIIENIPPLVESSAQYLTTSWPLILKFLRARNAKLVHRAFGAVDLIANQFLREIGKANYLKDFVKTLAFFGQQNYVEDLNVSIGAISLFLPVHDYITKKRAKKKKNDDDEKNEEEEEENNKREDLEIDKMLFFFYKNGMSRLMRSWTELKRNSTLSYFFDMTSPMQFRLDESKKKFLEEIFFDCLQWLIKRRNQVEDNEYEFSQSGSESESFFPRKIESKPKATSKKTKQDHDFVHHSRNTKVKQWDNTLSQTMMSVLQKFLTTNIKYLNAHPSIGRDVFGRSLDFVKHSILGSPQQGEKSSTFQKMLKNGLSCPLPLLKSKSLNFEYQKMIWNTLSETVWLQIVTRKNWVDDHLIARFLVGILDVLKRNEKDSIFEPLSSNNENNNNNSKIENIKFFLEKILSSIVQGETFETRKVRNVLLEILFLLAKKEGKEARVLILDFFLDELVPKPDGILVQINKSNNKEEDNEDDDDDQEYVEIGSSQFLGLLRGVSEAGMIDVLNTMINKIYFMDDDEIKEEKEEEEENEGEKTENNNNNNNNDSEIFDDFFIKIVKKLGTLMLLRYVKSKKNSGKLWKHSISCFDLVVRKFIKYKANTSTSSSTNWNIVCLVIEDFLFSYFKYSVGEKEEIDEELKMVALVGDLLKDNLNYLTTENRNYMITMLEKSTTPKRKKVGKKMKSGGSNRLFLFKSGIDVLFNLLSSNQEVCELMYNIVKKRVFEILSKYLNDSENVKAYGPLGESRRLEVIHILKSLRSLSVCDRRSKFNEIDVLEKELKGGEKCLLMEIFPVLNKFVGLEDIEIRKLLVLLLNEICGFLKLL